MAEVIAQSDWVNKSVIVGKICVVIIICGQVAWCKNRISSLQKIISWITSIREIKCLVLFDDFLSIVPNTSSVVYAVCQISWNLANSRVLNLSKETYSNISPLNYLINNIIILVVLGYHWIIVRHLKLVVIRIDFLNFIKLMNWFQVTFHWILQRNFSVIDSSL